jgi:hypothetical protein
MSKEASKHSNMSMVLFRDKNGNISYFKLGVLASIVAYTVFINPWFILGMFELFIILYLFYAFWKIIKGSQTSAA